jgi:hypothetical protein
MDKKQNSKMLRYVVASLAIIIGVGTILTKHYVIVHRFSEDTQVTDGIAPYIFGGFFIFAGVCTLLNINLGGDGSVD